MLKISDSSMNPTLLPPNNKITYKKRKKLNEIKVTKRSFWCIISVNSRWDVNLKSTGILWKMVESNAKDTICSKWVIICEISNV